MARCRWTTNRRRDPRGASWVAPGPPGGAQASSRSRACGGTPRGAWREYAGRGGRRGPGGLELPPQALLRRRAGLASVSSSAVDAPAAAVAADLRLADRAARSFFGVRHRDRRRCALRLLVRRGLDARLEELHQVDEVRALRHRLGLGDLDAVDLGLDDGHQRLAVLVLVLPGVERVGHRLDELLRHGQLGGLELVALVGQVQVLADADLVRPVERREQHRALERIERGERLAVPDHDLADRREALGGQHLAQQEEGLAADLVGLDVVRLTGELGMLPGGVVTRARTARSRSSGPS